MTGIPQLKFDTANFASEDRFDAVSEMWRGFMTFKDDPRSVGDFFLRSNFSFIGDVSFLHGISAPMSFIAAQARDNEPLVTITLLQHGRREYFLGDRLEHQSTDVVYVTHTDRWGLWDIKEPDDALNLYIPPGRLELAPGQLLRSRAFPTSRPIGAMLRSMLLSYHETLHHSSEVDVGKIADSLCGFLQPILRDEPDCEAAAVVDFRRAAIQRYVEENIADHSMNPEQLCKQFGVSRATLYRLFDEEEGIMSYIANRRTQRVREELYRTVPRRGIVRAVAEKYGFYDMTQFNRTFRRHTGTTPGSVAGLLLPDTGSYPGAKSAALKEGSHSLLKGPSLAQQLEAFSPRADKRASEGF